MATKKQGKQPNILVIWGDDIGQSVQKPNTFTVDDALAKMSEAMAGSS